MKKFKAVRKSVKFEYEFIGGESSKFEYLEPTTEQIDGSLSVDEDIESRMTYTKKLLKDCLRSEDGDVDALIEEQTKHSNIYEFKNTLDEELGKLKKNG